MHADYINKLAIQRRSSNTNIQSWPIHTVNQHCERLFSQYGGITHTHKATAYETLVISKTHNKTFLDFHHSISNSAQEVSCGHPVHVFVGPSVSVDGYPSVSVVNHQSLWVHLGVFGTLIFVNDTTSNIQPVFNTSFTPYRIVTLHLPETPTPDGMVNTLLSFVHYFCCNIYNIQHLLVAHLVL